jgi:hypothetical protein
MLAPLTYQVTIPSYFTFPSDKLFFLRREKENLKISWNLTLYYQCNVDSFIKRGQDSLRLTLYVMKYKGICYFLMSNNLS